MTKKKNLSKNSFIGIKHFLGYSHKYCTCVVFIVITLIFKSK